MTRAERAAEALRLRAEGLSYPQIAKRLGTVKSEAYKLIHPEKAREWDRRANAKPARRRAKREWDRNPANRKPCDECGEPTGHCHKPTAARLCRECYLAAEKAQTDERGRQIEKWWAEGLTLREIGGRLGWTVGHVGVEIDRLRKKGGFNLPNRRPYYGGGRRAA